MVLVDVLSGPWCAGEVARLLCSGEILERGEFSGHRRGDVHGVSRVAALLPSPPPNRGHDMNMTRNDMMPCHAGMGTDSHATGMILKSMVIT